MGVQYTSHTKAVTSAQEQLQVDIVDALVKNTEREVKRAFLDWPAKPFVKGISARKQTFKLSKNQLYRPIATGNLRRSVNGSIKSRSKTQVIGTVETDSANLALLDGAKTSQVGYAKFVEYGTYKMPPRPFMRNGVKKAEQTNDRIVQSIIRKQKGI